MTLLVSFDGMAVGLVDSERKPDVHLVQSLMSVILPDSCYHVFNLLEGQ